MVKGRDDKWGIIHMRIDPNLYYKLDGSAHITADFQAGGYKLNGVADGVDGDDGVNKSQLDGKLDITGKAADSNLLDGLNSTAFERALGNPSTSGYILSSTSAGVRSWIPSASGPACS